MLTCFGLRVIWWFVHFKRSSVSVKHLNCPLTITQQGRPSISKSILIYVGFLLYLFMVFVFSWSLLHPKACSVIWKNIPGVPGTSLQVTPTKSRMNKTSFCRCPIRPGLPRWHCLRWSDWVLWLRNWGWLKSQPPSPFWWNILTYTFMIIYDHIYLYV